jgi:hypothetical protein
LPDGTPGYTIEVDAPATWATAETWDPTKIPPRPWIAPGYLLRGAVTALVGAGGVSKSMLMIAYAVALALGRQYHGMRPAGEFRVVLFNAEDDHEEQQRRLSAVLTSMGVTPDAIAGKVLRIGPKKVATLLARDPETRALYRTRAMNELVNSVRAFGADVLMLDPLAELHTEEENANVALREVVAEFRSLAKEMRLALVLVHHTRKGIVIPGDMDASRGASSVVSAARIGLTVVGMTPDEAKALGLPLGSQRHHFRLDGGKSNYAGLTDCEWFERQSYDVGQGDQAGVPLPWTPPQDVVGLDARLAIQAGVEAGSATGPWSVKLSDDPRSIKHLLVAHGVKTVPGQRSVIDGLKDDGFVVASFRRANRAKAQGLRSPDGQPDTADWLPDDPS